MKHRGKTIIAIGVSCLILFLTVSFIHASMIFAAEVSSDVSINPLTQDGHYYVEISLVNDDNLVSADDLIFLNNRQALINIEQGFITEVMLATNPVEKNTGNSDNRNLLDINQKTFNYKQMTALAELYVMGESVEADSLEDVLLSPADQTAAYLSCMYFDFSEDVRLVAEKETILPVDYRLAYPDGNAEEQHFYLTETAEEQLVYQEEITGEQNELLHGNIVFHWDTLTHSSDSELTPDTHFASDSDTPYLSLNKTVLKLAPGQTELLDTIVCELSEIEEPETITFTSEDESLFSISDDGAVTALAPGETWIEVQAVLDHYESLTRQVKVIVYDGEEAAETVNLNEEENTDLTDTGSDTDNDNDSNNTDDPDVSDAAQDSEDDLYAIGDNVAQMTDADTGILIRYDTTTIDMGPDDMILAVNKLTDGSSYYYVKTNDELKDKTFLLYSIHLTDGQDITPPSRFLISIPTSEGWDNSKMSAYLVAEDGTITPLRGEADGAYYTFTTTVWGDFAIVSDVDVEEETTTKNENDQQTTIRQTQPTTTRATVQTTRQNVTYSSTTGVKTGDETSTTIWYVLLASAAVAIAIVLLIKKRQNKISGE